MERESGLNEPCSCGTCDICILFGSGATKTTNRSSVLIFRDCHLTSNNTERFKTDKNQFFEIKSENIIDRVKGTAQHPRQIERVAPSIEFDTEIIFNEYEEDNKAELLKKLKHTFELLSNDYLGGSGTRGYGKVDVSSIIQKIEELSSQ